MTTNRYCGAWVVLAVAMMAMGEATAWAADIYWNLANNGNWNVANNWSPNTAYPGQLDPADQSKFTGTVGRTVTLNVNVTNYSFTVDGTGAWTWSGANTLTIGGGHLNCNASNTAYSAFTAVLAGSGGVRLNSGLLRIANAANTYSGGVEVNGGILKSGPDYGSGSDGSSNDLGQAGVIVGAPSGTNDATLLIAGKYNNPLGQCLSGIRLKWRLI